MNTIMHEETQNIKAIGNAAFGNVVFHDKDAGEMIAVEIDSINADGYPASRYAPIGIVVVPSSWNVYGDGTCGVMSLSGMSCLTPDTGSNTEHKLMYWGQYNVDALQTDYDRCVVAGTAASPTAEATGKAACAYLPSDAFCPYMYVVACPTDPSAYYFDDENPDSAAPSPFLKDGSLNPVYIQTESPSSKGNCLSDFDGKGNTEVLIGLATSQPDWRTAPTIKDCPGSGYSPAACCCWRYHTEGTKQGDWYLPAMGELGCVMTRLSAINSAIYKLNSVYGTVGLELSSGYDYWSSSEYDPDKAMCVNTWEGYMGYNYKNNGYHARAFVRL